MVSLVSRFRSWLARELEVIQVMLDLGITSRERARRIAQRRRLRAARAARWGE